LSAAQVQEIERLRGGFERQAIKLDADRRIAQMDLASLLRAEPVELDKVEAKVREIERLRADLRIGRIRAIEQAKAQLTKEQRTRLVAIAERAGPWPRLSGPPRAPAPERFLAVPRGRRARPPERRALVPRPWSALAGRGAA